MRILHTSDWHLGKRLFKLDRAPEHERFLDWLLATLIEKEIDVLLIAGDIFDTPSPPHQSLETFYQFLYKVSEKTKTQTYIIAGNHDSGVLLEAPASLLKLHRVKVWGKISPDPKDHWCEIVAGDEKIHLCALPFFRSFELLPQGEGDIKQALDRYFSLKGPGHNFLMLHHLAGSFKAAGSEQVISLSGLESIPSEMFEGFSYAALGHIHKPQKAGGVAWYSGSPLPMRFSEIHPKSVMLTQTKGAELTSEKLSIPAFRELHVVKATEKDWKEKISSLTRSSELTPMVEVQLELSAPQMGLVDEIKGMLEEKEMELLSFMPVYADSQMAERRHERIFELSTEELFSEFYAMKFPEAPRLPEELKKDFAQLLEKVKNASSQA